MYQSPNRLSAKIPVKNSIINASFLLLSAAVAPSALAESGADGFSGTQTQSLDLGSAVRDERVPLNAGESVSIQVGDSARSLTSIDQVTAAELVAVQQILMTGVQTLQLGAGGVATGGSFHLSGFLTQALHDLVIPSGVTVLKDFGQNATFDLSGTLNNSGNFYAYSSVAHLSSAAIAASQIVNQSGAMISSVLPSNLAALSAVNNLNLSLFVHNDLINAGTIASSGSLNIVAGNSIVNSSALTAGSNLSNNAAIMQAMNNINLQAANIINSGTIASQAANINIAGQALANLAINNANGVLQAYSGSFNVRDSLFNAKADLEIVGGDILSRFVNLHSGSGNVDVNVGLLTGILNINAGEAHVAAMTPDLNFGQVNLVGDPTFINAGNLLLPAGTAGQPYIAVAGGNITVTPGFVLDTSSSTGNGGNVYLIAGANASLLAGNVVVTGRSLTGGDIDLVGLAGIDTKSTMAAGSGGAVTMVAFAQGAGSTVGGHIIVPTGATIRAGGGAGGTNGSLTAIAEATGTVAVPNGISLGHFSSASGIPSGTVELQASSPNITALNPLIIDAATGARLSGAITGVATQVASVSTESLLVSGPQIKIVSGDRIDIAGDFRAGGSIDLSAASGIHSREIVSSVIPVGANPLGVAVSPNGSRVYVANFNNNTVSVIDSNTNTVLNTILVGVGPTGVAVSPDGALVYVSNRLSDSVSVINAASGTVVQTIVVPGGPGAVTFNTSGSTAFVSATALNSVSFIDTATGTVSGAPVLVGTLPFALAFNHSNSLLYVGNQGSNNISVIEPVSRVTTTANLAFSPVAFGACPCGTKIFVADGVSALHLFSTETNTVIGNIPLGAGTAPVGVGINPTGSLAYAVNSGAGTVSTVTTLTNAIASTTTLGGSPRAFGGFASFLGHNPIAYVSNSTLDNLSVIKMPTLNASQYVLNTTSGPINVAIAPGTVQANNAGGSVVVTSASNISSTGGSGTAFQLATPQGISVNGPINAGIIDLHAINGVFSNTSTITTSGALFFIASPTIRNFGTLATNNVGGQSFLNLQAPNGILNLDLAAGSQTKAQSPGNIASINLNPAGGSSVTVNAASGSSVTADTIGVHGNRGQHTVNMRLSQVTGTINLTKSPTDVFIQNTVGNLSLGTVDVSQTAGSGSNMFVSSAANVSVKSIKGDYLGPQQNNTIVSIVSAGNVSFDDFVNLTAPTKTGGRIIVGATGSISMLNTATSAFDVSGASGGSISLFANTYEVAGLNADFSSLKSDGSTGSGGFIQVVSKSPTPITIGAVTPPNYIRGGILANGATSGGTIRINANGIFVAPGTVISANGTIGSGGLVGVSSSNPLTVVNNGTIRATNLADNSGVVGFSSSPFSSVNLSGTGTVHAGSQVSFGNLNAATMTPDDPVFFPPSTTLLVGGISIQQGAVVGNRIAIGPVSPPIQSATVLPASKSFPPQILGPLPEGPPNATVPTDRLRINFSLPNQVEKFVDSANGYLSVVQVSSAADLSTNPAGVQMINAGRGAINLQSGRILLTPNEDISVLTDLASIHVKAGSVVLINLSSEGLAVYDLMDGNSGHVKVSTADRVDVLAPGSALYLSKESGASLKSLNQEEFPLRASKEESTRSSSALSRNSSSTTMYSAEFSIPTALAKLKAIKQTDKRLFNRLCKGAAALTIVQNGRAPFAKP